MCFFDDCVQDGKTALQIASNEATKAAIRAGMAHRNAMKHLGKELISAAEAGDEGRCRDLMSRGAQVNSSDEVSETYDCLSVSLSV